MLEWQPGWQTRVRNLGSPSTEIRSLKAIYLKLRDLMANVFKMKRDNDNLKTTYCKRSLILSRNFVNFGPQTAKIGPSFQLSVNSALGFFAYQRTQVHQALSGNKSWEGLQTAAKIGNTPAINLSQNIHFWPAQLSLMVERASVQYTPYSWPCEAIKTD